MNIVEQALAAGYAIGRDAYRQAITAVPFSEDFEIIPVGQPVGTGAEIFDVVKGWSQWCESSSLYRPRADSCVFRRRKVAAAARKMKWACGIHARLDGETRCPICWGWGGRTITEWSPAIE